MPVMPDREKAYEDLMAKYQATLRFLMFVSDNAHMFSAMVAVLVANLFCHLTGAVIMSGAVTLFAAVKEGLYDTNILRRWFGDWVGGEDPDIAGSGWRDFFGYLSGVAIALAMAWKASLG